MELNLPTGEYIGGVYGVLKYIRSALSHIKPTKAIFVWDGGKSKRRVQMFPGYKASRQIAVDAESIKRRERYRSQRDILEKVLPQMGIRSRWLYGKEADDIIGRMVEDYKGKYDKVVVVSEDLDYAQLCDENVIIHFPIKGLDLTWGNFKATMGYDFEWHNIYRAVLGDGSDEIWGVKSVGPVTLLKWILKAESLKYPPSISSLVEVCKTEKGKKAEALIDNCEIVARNIDLMYMLAEEFTPREIETIKMWMDTPSYFTEDCVQVLSQYSFKSFLENFSTWSIPFRSLS